MSAVPGLHHVTAVCSAPQGNLDFYTRRLGQKLVKKTVNFDDPGTYTSITATVPGRACVCERQAGKRAASSIFCARMPP
ncbi:VOC family protein [Roseovarius sp. C03]|uniref:VOC family protein n=1 Tax=Roseovarius sp. C03 TaxID=3449222 RepID=UPI003EDC44D4